MNQTAEESLEAITRGFGNHQRSVLTILSQVTNDALRRLLGDILEDTVSKLPVVKTIVEIRTAPQIKFWVTPESTESDCVLYFEVQKGQFHAHVAKIEHGQVNWAMPDWFRGSATGSYPHHRKQFKSMITIKPELLDHREHLLRLFAVLSESLRNGKGIIPKISIS